MLFCVCFLFGVFPRGQDGRLYHVVRTGLCAKAPCFGADCTTGSTATAWARVVKADGTPCHPAVDELLKAGPATMTMIR